jgi:hypothetical protein
MRLWPTSADPARKPKLVLLFGGVGLVFARLLSGAPGPDRIQAPRPASVADSATFAAPFVSSLDFPVRVRLQVLVDEVEHHVPVAWGSVEEPVRLPDRGSTRASVALRRSPFRASLSRDTARMSATILYTLEATRVLRFLPDIDVSCGREEGEPRPRLDVTLEAPISLTGDWSLATETRVARVAPYSSADRDRCQVTLAGFDITGSVVDAARGYLEEQRDNIDAVVAEADVRSSFQRWWDVLRDPVELAPGLWLELRPAGVRRGPVRGAGDFVEIRATLEASPRVVFGEKPERWPTTLPELSEGATEEGFEILVEGVAEYAEVTRRLNDAVGGMSVAAGGKRLEIESLELSGIGGGRVAVEVRVGGDARGALFLVGTPRYRPEDDHVSVPDLGLTVSTSNLLLNGASWILDAGLEAILRERARWPVDFVVAWAEQALGEGLNTTLADGLRLEGGVDEFRVTEVAATRRGLIVRARATGEAALAVDGKG